MLRVRSTDNLTHVPCSFINHLFFKEKVPVHPNCQFSLKTVFQPFLRSLVPFALIVCLTKQASGLSVKLTYLLLKTLRKNRSNLKFWSDWNRRNIVSTNILTPHLHGFQKRLPMFRCTQEQCQGLNRESLLLTTIWLSLNHCHCTFFLPSIWPPLSF